MGSPSTVLATKELKPQAFAPVLLAELRFLDNSVLYLSTKPLNTSEGGFAYGGNNYLARLAQQDIAAVQERSEQGVDRVPEVTLHINDSDRTIWTSYETAAGKGFRGAILTLRFIFWSADTSSFSSDSTIPFIGLCETPRIEREGRGDVMVVKAGASRNLQRVFFPVFHIQQRCSNVFPATAAQRLAGATDMSSQHWGCGYDPDQSGTDPEIGGDCRRGNYVTGSTPFTDCDYTKANCVARGMYKQDSSVRNTGRFTGQQWSPPNRETQSKSYIEGKTVTVLSGRNDAIYAERVPVVYGLQWIHPIVVNSLGDGNSTRHEVIVCQDDIATTGIAQVVVNGVVIPFNGPDPLFTWRYINTGSRNGTPNTDALYDGNGDPYGSLATIEVVYYRQLGDSASVPDIRILTRGPTFKTPTTATPTDQASWTKTNSKSPAFVLCDLLIWANHKYSDIDLQSIIDEAAYGAVLVTYTDLNGNTSTQHARYKAQFAIEKQRGANEVIQALCRSFNAQVVRNPTTGLLSLFIRKTLADQQPSPVSGSNYSTAVSSFSAAGNVVNGYAAFKFDESTVLRQSPDDPPFIHVFTDPQAPNTVQFSFQDEDNQWQQDSITILDADAINRAGGYQGGQQIVENLNILGISNFDQGARISRTYLAEKLRGNPIGDTRGTLFFEVRTNFRVVHLRVGHLCLLTWQSLGITNQLVRVTKIQPTTDWESATVTLMWHSDLWYTDAYGQQATPLYSDPGRTRPLRRPYPWMPYGIQPITNDSVFWDVPLTFLDGSWWNFGISQTYEGLADGTALAKLSVTGCPPVNDFSTAVQPPLMGIQGATATTGGSIPGGVTVYLAIAAKDSSGKYSALSKFAQIVIPSGTNTNTVTTPTISWQGGSTGYIIFAGIGELELTAQGTAGSTPSTITLTAMNYATYGPPDQLASAINFRAKRVIHGGVFGDACTAVGSGTITFAPPTSFTTNAFAGYDLALVAKGDGDDGIAIPWAHFRVVSNTGTVFTVTPNPSGLVDPGDVFVMMFRAGTITSTELTDANLVNPYAPTGLVVDSEIGNILRIIGGKGRPGIRTIVSNTATSVTVSQAFDDIPDSTSRYIVEEPSWQYDIATERKVASDPAPSTPPEVAKINVDNYRGQTIMVQANIQDADANGSLEPFAPLRMVYIWGRAGTTASIDDGFFEAPIVSDHVAIDLANGLNQRVILNQATQVTIDNPIFTGGTIKGGSWLMLYVEQDTTGQRPGPAFGTAYGADVLELQFDLTLSTRTALGLTFDGAKWRVDTFHTGLALT